MNCKNCGREVKHTSTNLFGEYCNENCFWSYNDRGKDEQIKPIAKASVKPSTVSEVHFGVIKKNVFKFGQFVISQQTLTEYLPLQSFGDFLVSNNFMVVKSDSELSVIKKSII